MTDSLRHQSYARAGNSLIHVSGGVLLISSFVKFLHPAKVVAYMGFLGYSGDTLYLIAAVEMLIALLFLRRSTRWMGLLLVSAYLGGAIAAHIAYHPLTGTAPILLFNFHHHFLGSLPPAVVLAAAWIGFRLRHPEAIRAMDRTVPDASSAVPGLTPSGMNRAPASF
jgi:hypothetical protein